MSFATEPVAHDATAAPTPPSAARVWNKLRGGKDNYAADAALACTLTDTAPDLAILALERPAFYARAARHLTEECGVTQFIDISPGYPAPPEAARDSGAYGLIATNLITRHINPLSRTLYVEEDSIVAAHLRALVADDHTECITARRTHTAPITEAASDLFDLSRPVAVLLRLDHVSGDDIASGYLGDLADALCPGSFVVLTNLTADGPFSAVAVAAEKWNRAGVASVRKVVDEAPPVFTEDSQRLVPRTAERLAAIVKGHHLTPLSPGFVSCSQWAGQHPLAVDPVADWAAVTRKG